ncbi:DsbA family protein [Neisseria weixii]|uniref:DsbA family oxidoreductase n=1 Tax=Neisseria weixii TaxID=1853276 RepID=UPI000BB74E59|nr:DsbA family oxidoreductase [Neisseria weixii]ATD64169.1 disulfide bond formation protein DsbA [Neisseria weixii]
MKIQIWSDYACPYCYIGKRHLEHALAQFARADEVQVEFKAFELYPHAGKTAVNTTQQRIEKKYGKPPQGALEMIAHIEKTAARAGLEMNYRAVKNTNTFDAHRLAKWADSLGKGQEMHERLMRAYFTDNAELADRDNLAEFAADVGLNGDEAKQMLACGDFVQAVKKDENEAAAAGVQGVPFFVFDGKTTASGAMPADSLLKLLNQVYQEQQSGNLTGAACGIDGCG